MTKIKPRFKRFEMHGNLPTAKQAWHCGKCIKIHDQPKEVYDRKPTRTEVHKSAEGGAMIANTPITTNTRIKEVKRHEKK